MIFTSMARLHRSWMSAVGVPPPQDDDVSTAPSSSAAAVARREFILGLQPGDPEQENKCRSFVDKALSSCPKVKFMREALKALGVRSSDADFVTCAHCPDGAATAGGYLPEFKLVLLCQQWVAQQPSEVENTLTHEMIHAYDDARAHMNWMDLTQHACTEIRAASLSGDCNFRRELDRGNLHPANLGGAGARCVRRRAELSVAMHPECPDADVAAKAVARAWETCYADKAPFDAVGTHLY